MAGSVSAAVSLFGCGASNFFPLLLVDREEQKRVNWSGTSVEKRESANVYRFREQGAIQESKPNAVAATITAGLDIWFMAGYAHNLLQCCGSSLCS